MLLLCCNLLFSISIKIASVSEICLPFTKYFFIASPSLDYLAYNVTTNPLLSAAAASVQTCLQCSLDEFVEEFCTDELQDTAYTYESIYLLAILCASEYLDAEV